jgi:hypothetical protein
MNEACKQAQVPAQQLNDIAAGIIDTLADANTKVSIIKDRLFEIEPEKVSQTGSLEPSNLEARLRLIRTIAQDINDTLCMVQNRV